VSTRERWQRHLRVHPVRPTRHLLGGVVTTWTAVFQNAGRGTKRQAEQAWAHIGHASADVDFAVVVEVDEGDKGYSDHTLAANAMRHMHAAPNLTNSREMLWVADPKLIVGGGVRRGGRSVRHWSPPRPVHYTDLRKQRGRALRVIYAHPAAGAGRQGRNRPTWARPLLQTSWDASIHAIAELIQAGHAKGYDVALLTDANSRILEPVLAREIPGIHCTRLFVDMPDYGLCWPAKDATVSRVKAQTFANPIEPKLHQGHHVRWRVSGKSNANAASK
jgi:hypothetical protein